MWKLIKSEFCYLKYILLASYLYIIVIAFTNQYDYLWLTGARAQFYSPWRVVEYVLPKIILLHYVVNFALIYLYLRERRLRQYADLPIRTSYMGLAKLATPFLIALSFVVLASICIALTSAFHWNDVVYLWKELTSPKYSYHNLYHHVDLYHQSMFLIFRWMFFTYAFWLLSEKYGRVILIAYVVFIPIHDGILPLFKAMLAWKISEFITYKILGNMVFLGYAAIFFAFIIFISFMRRRSYFW
jgi:hypothetical protein